MKVLVERDKFLSDYEVAKHLKSMKYEWTQQKNEKRKKFNNQGGIDLEIITNETLQYLSTRPCATVKDDEDFKTFMAFLNTLALVKVEKLEIINSLPRSMVHLYSIIDECDTRFSADVCEEIIGKIDQLFPIEDEEENDDDNVQEPEDNQEEIKDTSMME